MYPQKHMKWKKVTEKKQRGKRKCCLSFFVLNLKHLRQLLIPSLMLLSLPETYCLQCLSVYLVFFTVCVPTVNEGIAKAEYKAGDDRNR